MLGPGLREVDAHARLAVKDVDAEHGPLQNIGLRGREARGRRVSSERAAYRERPLPSPEEMYTTLMSRARHAAASSDALEYSALSTRIGLSRTLPVSFSALLIWSAALAGVRVAGPREQKEGDLSFAARKSPCRTADARDDLRLPRRRAPSPAPA